MNNDTNLKIKDFDPIRQPLSVEIKDICAIPHGLSEISLGLYKFSKVFFCGKIVSIDDDEGCCVYTIIDMENNSDTIKCINYNMNLSSNLTLLEELIVGVTGKLHYNNNQLDVIIFSIYEITDLNEVNVIKWGARLAKLEFESGLLNLLYDNPFQFYGVKGYSKFSMKDKEVTTDCNDNENSSVKKNIRALSKRIIMHLKEMEQEKFTINDITIFFQIPVEQICRAVEFLEYNGNVFLNDEGYYELSC